MNLNRCCYSLLIFAAIGCIFTAHPLVIWFLLANILTLLLYGVDKMAARKDWRRVPESTLLVFGVVGGWGGAAPLGPRRPARRLARVAGRRRGPLG